MLKGKYVAKVTYEFNIPNDELELMIDAVKSDKFGDVITVTLERLITDELKEDFTDCKVEMVSFKREEVPE